MPYDESRSDSGIVYRFVSDGAVPRVWTMKNWLALLVIALFLLCFGVITSIDTNAASLPHYWGQVILIGIALGIVLNAGAALVVVLAVLVGQLMRRRTVRRLFPAGSTTEVALGEDSMVIRRPTGERTLPYRGMSRVRRTESWIRVFMRGEVRPELLPVGILPEAAIGPLRGRVGHTPMAVVPDHAPTCSMLVPAGWAAHLASVYRRATVRSAGFWVSTLSLLAVGGLLGLISPGWWLVGPLLILVRFVVVNTRARDAMARALPSGSTATTYVLEDRFISRNAGGTREFLFDDIRRATVHDDVVVLWLVSVREQFLIARALLPPDTLAGFVH